jgi:hypothetical protein
MGGRADSAAHVSAISKINSVAKHAAEIREHLEQIIHGPAFKGSHRGQSFLRHVVERSLAGDFEGLRERSIGVELFGKSASYDTGEDAVVRVTASDVRKRLLQHYGGAGSSSKLRIEIPSGSYLPEFHLPDRQESSAQTPSSTLAVAHPTAAAPQSASAITPALPPPGAKLPILLGRRSAVLLAVLLLVSGTAAGIMIGRASSRPAAPPDDLIGAMFSGVHGAVQVLVSDEGLVLTQVLMGHSCSLQDYEDLTCWNAPELQQDNLRRIRTALSTREMGNIGDIQNAVRINERLRARNWDVVVRHARQAHARDFRSGNFIILGGTFGNPWASLFQIPDSNFPLEKQAPPGKVNSYLNLQPKTGEPAVFSVDKGINGGRTTTYAKVTLLDSTSHNGRVLLVAGQSVSATELATDFLFHRDSAAKTRRLLGVSEGGALPNLEMILRVTEMNQIGESVQLVACRRVVSHSD